MGLSGLKKHFNSMKNLIKGHNEDSNIGYFLEADVQYIKVLP